MNIYVKLKTIFDACWDVCPRQDEGVVYVQYRQYDNQDVSQTPWLAQWWIFGSAGGGAMGVAT